MSWTTPRELKAQLARLWDRGDVLRPIAGGATRFPLRLDFKRPSSADLTDRFEDVRRWAAEIAGLAYARIEWREVRHRVQGEQRLPDQIWVDCTDDALAWLGKRREAQRFAGLVTATRDELPAATAWLVRRPLAALELADDWPRLMAVVRWVVAHPRPGVYLRQVDVPGVHSKFIEHHRAVLSELLDLALPAEAIEAKHSGTSRFAPRYGFRDKPVRIRFRVLDDALRVVPGTLGADVTLDADNFARIDLPVRRVLVTENETNFLALPAMPSTLAIFGAGYGWDALAQATWLNGCALHYWGDIDTHGFAILDALRTRFAHVASLLMDRETLLAHEAHWTEEPDPVRHDLPRLTADEHALYEDLRCDRIAPRLRLEQERIGYDWVLARIAACA